MISINGVTKSFSGKPVLHNINLSLAKGETHVFLGSSGCGKSTLIRLLMGLIPADSGDIMIGGFRVTSPPTKAITGQIGYVIQDGGLFPHMTAEENVTLVARLRKNEWDDKKIKTRLLELSDLVGFGQTILKKFPSQLSGGQKQRVGLIRALMLAPAVLLMDEPLGALDPIVRASLQDELKKTFNKLKITVVLVTHDIGEAAYFGHTVTLLKEGSVMQHGPFEDFVEKPANPFVTEFIHAQRPPPQLRGLL
jgi:osmoprotectant transport system ATP-binding protein